MMIMSLARAVAFVCINVGHLTRENKNKQNKKGKTKQGRTDMEKKKGSDTQRGENTQNKSAAVNGRVLAASKIDL